MNDLLKGRTPAVKNMEKAWSRAGASNTHTPGVASKLGSQEQPSKEDSNGVGGHKFRESISDQRSEPSAVGKWANRMLNGSEGGK